MSSYLCFLCHNPVDTATNEAIREKYRDVVGVILCLESHLCYMCTQLLIKLDLFRTSCLKQSLEYPVLFSEKLAVNIQKTETEYIMICPEQDCEHYSKTSINIHHFYHEDHINFDNDKSNEYADLADENVDNEYDINNDNFQDDIEYDNNFHDDTEYDNNHENVEYDMNYDDQLNDDFNDNEVEENDNEVDNFNDNTNTISDILNESEPSKKRRKKDKKKKRSYEKIILSLKEQKEALELQRKDQKYLESDYKCHRCALRFLFKDSYQSHMMRHEESNGQYSCAVCGLRFATQNARCMHVILHSELYKCNKCGVKIKRPHRKRHSRECWGNDVDTASCHLCGKEFKDANCLQQHLKRFHLAKTSSRTYSCNVCGKAYKEPNGVRTHMIKHINRRFQCKQCPSTFASPYTLSQHQKVHTNPYTPIQKEEYSCMTCNTSYKSKKNLLAHFRNTLAHQQTSYECPICGRNCANARSLQSHIETHTSARAHPRSKKKKAVRVHANALCHHCGAGFAGKNKLTRHLKEVCERARIEEEIASFYEQADLQCI